ncbi:T9SS type B sorting domain-containing protein [Empedobacter sp. UBA7620]|uniref:T9SS type B sorting domain-containing protein n=1 Tax=Empedobacter sp. UBA7620 TaxID=1946452 RepID=UPI0025B9FF22|nr:T9SS type B sorting domain-containing protein [Empedobacter sp. UBA7620]
MKKIFYFLLLMISWVVWGQYPTIHPLTGGFTFTGEKLETHLTEFTSTTSQCGFNSGKIYKFYSFEANFDMVFAFDLTAKKPDFRFLVWKIQKGKLPETIFYNGGTINADRSVQGASLLKGMKEGDPDLCETFSGANGYAKAFEGSELLKRGEIVVIAVYGGSDTEPFDIKVNVAEERTITNFNNLCFGLSYSASQIYNAIQSDSGFNDIKLFTDNTFSTEIPIGTSISSDTTLYAQVRDSSGNLKFIYTIPITFIPEHQFNFKTNIETEYACTISYTIPSEADLLKKLFIVVNTDYSISSIVIDGTNYTPGQNVNLAVGLNTSMKIKVHYGGGCPIDSNEVSIPLVQGKPILTDDISDATCDSSYKINFDRIYSKLGKDKNAFDVIVTLGGLPISDGQSTVITTTLTYKIKIKSRTGGGCESDEVDFVVTKTSPAKIVDASINRICLADFNQTDLDKAILIINLGKIYNLRFYKQDGTEILESELFNYIKTNKIGKIIVKALAVDNGNTICDTDVELTFKLDESTFQTVSNIPTLNSSCSEVGLGHTFTISEIEAYLKSKFGRTDITFNGISDEFLTDNQSKTITFQVKINGEGCWSEEMILKLQVITKPNVNNALHELKADCDDKITIDAQVLINLFGSNSIVDYHYEILHNNSTPLTFDASGKASVKVLFKNKLDNSCFIEKEIIINKKQDLIIDIAILETYIKDHPIIYCEEDDVNAKKQIEDILDYIKSKYPILVAKSTVDEIYTMFNSNNGFVEIVFEDPNYCGTEKIKFYYQKNALPDFAIPASAEICSATKYELDFEQLAKEKGLDVTQYDFSVVGEDAIKVSTYQYELGVGDYTITISNKDSGCPKVFTLKLTNSETPIINKITINEKSVIVSAKGNGKLEYALFDSVGNVIVDWQTKNELIIPDNIKNNNFTVRVRLNNCGVSERKNVIYLAIPNVVTPNNDGFNDIWQPMTKDGKVTDTSNSYKLIIFDRYGKQILTQEGTDIIKWDGTLNGKPVADGTYWYLLEFSKQSDDLQVLYSGSILVKRKIN